MNVLVTLDIPDVGVEMIKKEGIDVTVWKEKLPMTQEQLIQKAKHFNMLLTTSMDKIDQYFLNECSHLQMISQYGSGFDNIDVSWAAKLGIPVGNAPGAMSAATADIAFILMLAASRKITYLHKSIIADAWGSFDPKAYLGIELKGKTLGIFGLGRIGMEMGKRCRGAYDMNIIYCNRSPNEPAEKQLQAQMVSFDELLAQSDILSVHCVMNEDTKGLFNAAAFNKMKSTAIFINTSRGAIHNEGDLLHALITNQIWGAGLDVTNPEPMRPDNPLLSMENVVITPHIGSATVAARGEMSRLAAQNIIQFYRGDTIVNRVN